MAAVLAQLGTQQALPSMSVSIVFDGAGYRRTLSYPCNVTAVSASAAGRLSATTRCQNQRQERRHTQAHLRLERPKCHT